MAEVRCYHSYLFIFLKWRGEVYYPCHYPSQLFQSFSHSHAQKGKSEDEVLVAKYGRLPKKPLVHAHLNSGVSCLSEVFPSLWHQFSDWLPLNTNTYAHLIPILLHSSTVLHHFNSIRGFLNRSVSSLTRQTMLWQSREANPYLEGWDRSLQHSLHCAPRLVAEVLW